jgi:hypothetical protein
MADEGHSRLDDDLGFDLTEGARVTVGVLDGGTCVAQVERVAGVDFSVDMLDRIEQVMPPAGDQLSVYVGRPEGMRGWRVRIREDLRDGKASFTAVGRIATIQRRRHARVDVDLPAEARRVVAHRLGPVQQGRLADLSPGGLRLVGPFILHTSDSVEVTVDLGEGPVALHGPVVLAYSAPGGGRVVHVALSPVRSGAQDQLVAFWARHRARDGD